MVNVRDENLTGRGLLLEVALQTKGLVALREHALVDRAVRGVTGDTALAQGFMFENEWTALRGMTLEAGIVLAKESHPATLDRLMPSGAAAFDCISLVRIVAIGAADFAFKNWMVMRQIELGAHL